VEETASFLGVLPESLESFALREPLLDLDPPPVLQAVLVSPETLGSGTL